MKSLPLKLIVEFSPFCGYSLVVVRVPLIPSDVMLVPPLFSWVVSSEDNTDVEISYRSAGGLEFSYLGGAWPICLLML